MEDYKQKYETAINQAKEELKACGDLNCDAARQIFRFFPELKESDERIRKEILEYFHQFENEELRRINISDWIAWLEKQDPKKHEEELEKAYKTADEVQYKKGYEDAKREFEKQGEQKPAWSEEDEKMWITISDLLWEGYKLSDKKVSWDKIRCWLLPKITYFKDRVQTHPKQEWSEKDEKMLDGVTGIVEDWYNAESEEEKEYYGNCGYIDWLKSLKERYTWKPSDEQIKLLREVQQALLGKDCHNRFVNFMYELKRLREE